MHSDGHRTSWRYIKFSFPVQNWKNTFLLTLLTGLGLKDKIKIRIEFGLFEWMIWYPDEMPEWLTKDELIAAKYNIDMEYVSMYTRDQLKAANTESSHEFYKRNFSVVEQVLKTNGIHVLR